MPFILFLILLAFICLLLAPGTAGVYLFLGILLGALLVLASRQNWL